MSENALDRKGELGRYSTSPNQKLTRQCEQASGILHPCRIMVTKVCLRSGIVDTANELIYKCVRPGFRIVSSIFNENRHL